MDDNELEKKLDSLTIPDLAHLSHSDNIKLAIISAKKSSKLTLWLLMIPFLILFSAALQSVFKVSIPPWSWIQKFSPLWPAWIRFGVFAMVLIIIPSIVVILNILSILWINYDRKQQVLHISIRIRRSNIIIIIVASILALLFLGHSVGEYMTGSL